MIKINKEEKRKIKVVEKNVKDFGLYQQLPKNLMANIVTFGSNVVIGLWLTPYLLGNLGIVAYGLIPLAMFFSQYISVIINSINISINKFLLESLHNNPRKANKIFNTSLGVVAIFVVLQSILMLVMMVDISNYFDVPKNLMSDAIWLFSLTFAGFSLSLFRSIFGTSLFAYNRIDILRVIDLTQNIIRVGVIVFLFASDDINLKNVGIANFVSSICAFFITLYYFKRYTPQLKINFLWFDIKKAVEISKLSSWILINQVGVLLLGNLDLYLVNKVLGAEQAGSYAIVVQVTGLFRTLATLFTSVTTPLIMIYYAKRDYDKLKKVVVMSAKFMLIAMLMPMVIMIGLSDKLIILWLGKEFVYLHGLMSFSLLFYIVAVPVMPFYIINVAYDKVKVPALVAITFGVTNVACAYFLLKYSGLALWGVVVVKLFFEIIFTGIFMPIYVSRILKVRSWLLLKIPLLSVLSFLPIYGLVILGKQLFQMDSLLNIIIFSVFLCVAIIPLYMRLLLSRNERQLLFEKYIKNGFKYLKK